MVEPLSAPSNVSNMQVDMARRTLVQQELLVGRMQRAEALGALEPDVQGLAEGFDITPALVHEALLVHKLKTACDILEFAKQIPEARRPDLVLVAQEVVSGVVQSVTQLPLEPDTESLLWRAFAELPLELRAALPDHGDRPGQALQAQRPS